MSAPTVAELRRGHWIMASTARLPSAPPIQSMKGRSTCEIISMSFGNRAVKPKIIRMA